MSELFPTSSDDRLLLPEIHSHESFRATPLKNKISSPVKITAL